MRGQVQIKVEFCGICGTDLHLFHCAMAHRLTLPHVMGHEMSGTLAAVGEGVAGWKVGDRSRVVSFPDTIRSNSRDMTCQLAVDDQRLAHGRHASCRVEDGREHWRRSAAPFPIAESARGISPRAAHRSGRDTLASSGSC